MNKILIAEDNVSINELLKEALQKEGFLCGQAFSGTEACMCLEREQYALVLLDLMMPGLSGEEVLAQIRSHSNLSVIVLTAQDMLEEKVKLLSEGADDYITKPFDIQEVVARIYVQLRHAAQDAACEQQLSFRELTLDRTTFEVSINGTVLPQITRQEFAILELLLKNPRQVFSKEAIFEYAWKQEYMGETKTLDVHISNIRKKIKTLTDQEYIETVWGIGYRLAH